MKAKTFLALGAVAALTLIVTACAPTATPAATSGSTAATAPTTAASGPTAAGAPTAASSAAFTCTDKIGCITIAPNDPVHIAYMLVTSGDNAVLGTDSKYGAQIAVDDHGGKVLGHTIQFDGQDEGCSADGGQNAATRIAADKTVVAVIGTSCSSAAVPAIPIISAAGLTMISPSATAVVLTDPAKHDPAFLRTAHNDSVQGKVAAQFVYTQLKLTRAATIHDGSPYAEGLQQVFANTFKQMGGTITDQEAINVGDRDMRPVLTKIAATHPQIIYFPIFIPEGGAIVAQARSVPGLENTVLMSADGTFAPAFLKAAGPSSVGMFWSSPNYSAYTSAYPAFLAKYEKKYNVKEPLSTFHAQAYDAMNMILAAIEKVAVKEPDGTLHIGRQALRDALYATKNFQGLTGTLTCNQYGDCADPHIAVYQETSALYSKGQTPSQPAWAPGGPNYQAPK